MIEAAFGMERISLKEVLTDAKVKRVLDQEEEEGFGNRRKTFAQSEEFRSVATYEEGLDISIGELCTRICGAVCDAICTLSTRIHARTVFNC